MRFADAPSPPAPFTGRRRIVASVARRCFRPGFRQSTSSSYRPAAAIDGATTNSIQPTKRPDTPATGRSVVYRNMWARATTRAATTSVAVLEKRRVVHPVVSGTGSRPRPVRLARPVAGLRRRRSNAYARSVEPESEPVRIVLRYAISLWVASHCITLRVWKPVALRPARPARGNTCVTGGRRMRRGSITQKAGHIGSRPHSPDSRGDRPKAASKFVQF